MPHVLQLSINYASRDAIECPSCELMELIFAKQER